MTKGHVGISFPNGTSCEEGRRFRHGALLCAFLIAAAAGACSSSDTPRVISEDANIYPADARAEIVAFLRTYLNDPTGIRGAYIAAPALKPAGSGSRYAVCVRFNAKKTTGEYEGSRDRIVYFLSGKLDTMVDARKDICSDAVYQPFPEIEQLRR